MKTTSLWISIFALFCIAALALAILACTGHIPGLFPTLRTVRRLEERKCKVFFEGPGPFILGWGRFSSIRYVGAGLSEDEARSIIAEADRISTIHVADFSGCQIADRSMQRLGGAENIAIFHFRDSKITTTGLKMLIVAKAESRLWQIDARGTKIDLDKLLHDQEVIAALAKRKSDQPLIIKGCRESDGVLSDRDEFSVPGTNAEVWIFDCE